MSLFVDRTNQRFGRLAVLHCAGRNKRGHALWECVCLCGNTTVVPNGNLQSGNTQSCGCLHKERAAELGKFAKRHGMEGTPEYKAWGNACDRTCNPKSLAWKDYGGRGITTCPEWIGPGGFDRFIAHIGLKPDPSLTLDRIDNDKGYEPGNVRWADRATQNRNQRPHKVST